MNKFLKIIYLIIFNLILYYSQKMNFLTMDDNKSNYIIIFIKNN